MSNDPEKRIIIDEDWKNQVEREKQQSTDVGQHEIETPSHSDKQLPPASFNLLISAIVAQILSALGQFPDPISQKKEIHLEYARHNIDLLAVLSEKTRGNLTSDEADNLDKSLHQLRLLYLHIQQSTE